MNLVKMRCPYCDHHGEATAISYHPMAALAGNAAYVRGEDGEGLKSKGEVKCEECGEWFLYKLDVEVVCKSAKRPNYN